jgi:hypothetical protein
MYRRLVCPNESNNTEDKAHRDLCIWICEDCSSDDDEETGDGEQTGYLELDDILRALTHFRCADKRTHLPDVEARTSIDECADVLKQLCELDAVKHVEQGRMTVEKAEAWKERGMERANIIIIVMKRLGLKFPFDHDPLAL